MWKSWLPAYPVFYSGALLLSGLAYAQPAQWQWQLNSGYENSGFSRQNRASWHAFFVEIGRRINQDTTVHLRTTQTNRSNQQDASYQLGTYTLLAETYEASAHLRYTPAPDVLSTWQIAGTLEGPLGEASLLPGNFNWTAALQHDHYPTLTTTVLRPGLRWYLNDAWQLHGQYIHVIDENEDQLSGWQLRLNWQNPEGTLKLFGGGANGPETESGQTVRTLSGFIGTSYQLNSRLTLHGSFAREERDKAYIRDILTAGITVNF